MPKISNKFSGLSLQSWCLRTTTLILSILLPSSFALSVSAKQLSNGQTLFDRSPLLLRAAASSVAVGWSGATYQFTISIPEEAGEPLQAVRITQNFDNANIAFSLNESRAFLGDSFAGGHELTLASIGGSQSSEEDEVTVVFDSPVPPGSTVTIALKAQRNPDRGGYYSFGITAFPAGENGVGQFLGYGRLYFYENSR